jgi:hypothetical protein
MNKADRTFENPIPEYEWQKEKQAKRLKWLASVKVGDTLWILSGGGGLYYSLRVVEKLTKTLIRCNGADFTLNDGLERKKWYRGSIAAIATEKEIAEYRAEEARKNQEWKDRTAAEEAQREKCKELQLLFGGDSIHVSKEGEGYAVGFHGLNEDNVRELAARLQVEIPTTQS